MNTEKKSLFINVPTLDIKYTKDTKEVDYNTFGNNNGISSIYKALSNIDVKAISAVRIYGAYGDETLVIQNYSSFSYAKKNKILLVLSKLQIFNSISIYEMPSNATIQQFQNKDKEKCKVIKLKDSALWMVESGLNHLKNFTSFVNESLDVAVPNVPYFDTTYIEPKKDVDIKKKDDGKNITGVLTAEVPQFDIVKTIAIILSSDGLSKSAAEMFPDMNLLKALKNPGIVEKEEEEKLLYVYNNDILNDYELRAKYNLLPDSI